MGSRQLFVQTSLGPQFSLFSASQVARTTDVIHCTQLVLKFNVFLCYRNITHSYQVCRIIKFSIYYLELISVDRKVTRAVRRVYTSLCPESSFTFTNCLCISLDSIWGQMLPLDVVSCLPPSIRNSSSVPPSIGYKPVIFKNGSSVWVGAQCPQGQSQYTLGAGISQKWCMFFTLCSLWWYMMWIIAFN
jgi:hypothetical protein